MKKKYNCISVIKISKAIIIGLFVILLSLFAQVVVSIYRKVKNAFLNLLLISSFKGNSSKQHIQKFSGSLLHVNVLVILTLLLLTGFNSNKLSAQNPGTPAKFEIDGNLYSGDTSASTHDWFLGTRGIGLIDLSETATYLALTQGYQNQSFLVGSNYNQYEVVQGRLLYESVFLRDHVDLSSSGGGNDITTFTGGNKNGDDPSTWTIITSSPGKKNDIVDSYVHLRRDGDNINTDLWFDLGVSYMESTGSHFIDFEFYKANIEISGNSFINSGPDQGHTSWQFDSSGTILSTGDIVMGFDYDGSTIGQLITRIWVKKSDFDNITPANFAWGSNFDGDNNGYGYAEISIPLSVTIYEVISTGNTLAPPWGTYNGTSTPFTLNYSDGSFVELGVNLTELGIDPRLIGGDACDSPFARVMVKSRTSTAFTSSLKDFSGPYDFLPTPIFDATILDPGDFYCSTPLQLEPVNPNGLAVYTWSTLDGEFADGTMSASGATVDIVKPGTYTLSTAPFAGCAATSSSIYIDAGPCAVDDTMGDVIEDNEITYNVVNNGDGTSDYDLNNNIDVSTLNNTNLLQPANGTITINNVTGQITYTPNPDFHGTDAFEYQICDATGLCDVALVSVTVTPEVDVIENVLTSLQDISVIIDVLANDNFEGTNHEVTSTTNPANGTVVINPDGTVTYTPNPSYTGEDVFEYTVTVTNADNTTNTETTTVTITVQDTEGPDIDTSAVNFEVQCGPDNTIQFNDWLNNNGYAIADDNSGVVIWSNNYSSFSDGCGASGIATVTFTATDPSGNISVTAATFFIVDNLPPTIVGYPSGVINNQATCVNIPELIFSNYTEESGDGDNNTFLQGEVFRFSDIAPDVDALLTIVATVNATVPVLDDNAIGMNSFRPRTAFSLTNTGDRAYAEFKFDFVVADTNTPSPLPEFYANFNDIDGNTSYSEQNWTDINTTYNVNNPTELTITSENPWLVATGGIVEYTGVTNSNPQVNITTQNTNATSFSFRMGAVARENNVSSSGRQHSVEFACIGSYTNSALIEEEITLECSDLLPAATLTATDQCGSADISFSEIRTNGDCDDNYTLLRQWVATDECGNTTTRNLTINVIDTTSPVLSGIPSDTTSECDAIPLAANPTAVDNCDTDVTIVLSENIIPGSCPGEYTLERTWTATDNCGNEDIKTQNITVTDNTDPVLAGVPLNTIAECNNIPTAATPTATDNCDADVDITFAETTTAGSCPENYTITRTWIATDHCGNTDTQTQIISVQDTTDPVLIGVPANTTVECNAIPLAAIPTATDNCDADVAITFAETTTAGSCPDSYTITRTWTATDNCGNTDVQSQTITVSDTTDPVLAGIPANTTAECNTIPVAANPTASDNCDADVAITFAETTTAESCPDSYTITRTWTATDNCGNTDVQSQTITVSDATDPVLAGIPANTTAECNAIPVAATPTASDNCDADVAITFSETTTAGSCPENYTITRTWTATDNCGNTDVKSQTISVSDTTDPVIAGSLPSNITVTPSTIPVASTLTANDNCDSDVEVTFAEVESGSYCDPSYTIIRTWTATDNCGNTDEHIQTITVTNPVLSVSINSVTDVLCFGEKTGVIDITVSGGTPPYTFLWNDTDGSTNEDLTNVIAGNYNVTVTDANNCTTSMSATIAQPTSPLGLTLNKVDATSIQGCTDGTAIAVTSGGTAPYTFVWSASAGSQTTATASNLPVGNHTVVVTDANNCEITQSIQINCTDDCDTAITTGTITDVLCFGDATGAATVSASSVIEPTATFTFTWSNGQIDAGVTSSTISNVIAGDYTVSVTLDGSVCDPMLQTLNISEPTENLSASITSQSDIVCVDLGQFTIEGIGGTPPYSYSIDNGTNYVTNGTFTGLIDGSYTVIVKDSNDCIFEISTDILTNCTDAIADINNTLVNQPVSGNVLTNDEDFEGDNQTVTANTNPANGSVVVNPDGTYIYTPNPGFIGEDTFEYTICDDGNPIACDTATVYIEVLPEGGPDNEAPIANADTATTPEGTPIDIVVIANDFDPDADPITITATTNPANGNVTLNPNGTITYTPDAGFIGEDTFTYTICDDGTPQLCDTATVTVTVQPAGYPNTTNANDDAYIVTPTSVLNGNVLTNDNDIEGDTQTVTTTTVITSEGVTVNIDPSTGVFTYTPNAGYSGTDSFVYTICDNGSPVACDDATVYITIEGVAGLSIVKSATSTTNCVGVGDNVTYIFTVTNSGDILINSITITDDLLGGDITATLSLIGDTNNDGLLDPTETWIFTAPDYTITQADVDAGNITNNVTADGLEPDGTTTVQATDTYVIDANNTDVTLCDASGIAVVKAASSATVGCVGEGDLVTYTFTVTNTGDVSINSITITDDLLGGDITATLSLTGDNGDGILHPTETWVFTAPDYTITQADVDAGNITNNVTADGLEPDGTTTVQATDTYVIDANNTDVTLCDASGIAVVKAASSATVGCVGEGDLVTYTFTVTNTGDVSINSITITDDLLGGDITATLSLTGDTNNDGLLDPTETWIFTAPDYTITQADVDAGNITNNVTADGLEPDGTTTVQATDTYVIDANNTDVTLCDASGIAVVKAASSATVGCVGEGDLVTYTFTVTNTGDVSINSITITDDLLGGDITATLSLTGDNGDGILHPTETWVFTAPDYTITQADVDAGNITNNVTADGLEPDGTTTVQSTDTYVIDANNTDVKLCDASGIAVVKAASSATVGCVGEGDLVTYTFTVTNTGDVSINSITITDDLLGGDITATLSLTGDTNNDGLLDPTETWIFTAPDYTITQADVDAGNITNNVTADGLEPDGTTTVQATDTYVIDANNTDVTLCDASGIAVVKAASSATVGCVGEGDLVTYTFTVTNTGDVSINSITITDDLLGGDITATLSLTGDNGDGILHPTETWVFTAPDYTITQADVDAGNITNNVTADGLEPDGTTTVQATDTYVIDANNTDVTLCDASGIAVVKAASSATVGCVGEGDLVTYTFTVTNTGDVSINSITITDDLLGGDITATLSLTGDTNNDGLLDPTETWIFTAPDYTITQADVDAGNITNNVTADGLEPDGTTTVQATDTYVIDANNTDVTLCDASGIAVVKAASSATVGCVGEGDLVTYTFTVTNTGDVSINSITITDNLLGGDITATLSLTGDNGDGILHPTETWVFTAPDYTITQADVDAGNITNNVTADGLEPDGTTTVQATDTYVIDANNTDVTLCDDSGIQLIKTGVFNNDNGNDCTEIGETITYTFIVTNNGDIALENVIITDPLLDNAVPAVSINFVSGDTDGDNQLDPTETWVYNATYLVTQIDIDATEVINTATVTAAEVVNGTSVTAISQTTTDLIEDTTPPDTSSCAVLDETIECSGTDNETIANDWNAANILAIENCATDACDNNITVTSDYAFGNLVSTCGAGGTITVIYTLTDATGNASTFTAILTLEDTTGPDLSACTVVDETIECNGSENENIATAWNAANIATLETCGTDTCDVDPTNVVTSDYDFTNLVSTCGAGGTITVTYTVADDCGNTSTLNATLTIADTTAPTFSVPADITIECDVDAADLTLTGDVTDEADNCSTGLDAVYTDSVADGSCPSASVITRTWSLTDDCDNTTTFVQTITVQDTTAPTFSVPADITIECDVDAADLTLTGDVTDEADNCSTGLDAVYTDSVADGSCPSASVITRTWSLTDDCDNTTTFVQTITVQDTTAPTFSVPADITIECDVDAADLTLTGDVTDEADNCSTGLDAVYTDSVADGSCPSASVITRTWSLTDDCDNTTTFVQTITVQDTTAPTFSVPADITIECDVDAADLTLTGDVTDEADNCSTGLDAVYTDSVADGSCPSASVITRTWSLTDDCDNTTTFVQTITVQDTTAPTFSVPADITIECDVDAADLTLTGDVTDEADNCSTGLDAVFTDSVADGSCPSASVITRTWSLTDDCDNTTTFVQTITVQDTTAPTFSVPADITIECDVDAADLTLTGDVTDEADNCSTGLDAVYTDSVADGSCPSASVITRTWSLTDDCDNTTTFVQTITVQDTTAPTFSVPADITIECDVDAADLTLTGDVTDEADNCSTGLDAVYTDSVADGSCPSASVITRTWSLTDDCDNTTTFVQTITVQDTTAPTFSVPADITIECDVDAADLTLTGDVTDEADNCSTGLDAVFTDSITDGSCPNESVITRTWSLTDECDNATTFVQTITLQDTTTPTFNETLPADTNTECDNVSTAETLTATDNCGTADVEFIEATTNGSCIGDYIIERTWIATDSCGNETVHTQIITVEDNTAPTMVTPLEGSITVACDDIPEIPSLVFEDSCSNNINVSFNESSTQTNDFEDYEILRTWTVIDDCGNEVQFTQNIIVEISNVIETFDSNRCVLDIEFDLFDLLTGDFNMDGIWSVVSGNATIDGSYFDPGSVEVGIYTFMYSITEGPCPKEVEVNVTVDDDCVVLACGEDNVVISKTVTANGDGYNDFFTITGVEVCDFVVEVQIFNRWGAEIYKSNNYQNDWDGLSHKSSVGNSGKVPTGTYYYIVNLRNSGLAPFTGPIYVAAN